MMVVVFSEVLSFCKLISFSVLALYNWTGLNFHAENSKYVVLIILVVFS